MDPLDPVCFSLELDNTRLFRNALSIADNVDVSLGTLTILLPSVHVGVEYYLQAVNVSNVDDVFAQSSDFSIGAAMDISQSNVP
ncbi:hypothetical protein SCP_0501560 [Sparassis crispa]|uniref:Uncharacterized protein n=1 Tax=Sparassis crispa TaxID=139825 RepID=A0A401GLU2_9APHY|nr:hypothetical protein SCP_0501560 [Sparassis crispa]GBE83109.1 hypothetical protein SCP_0501560 [Sparassis crispa]